MAGVSKNMPGMNYGSPLARKNSRSSPLATNVINNKFSIDYIQDHDGKNTPNNNGNKYIDLSNPIKKSSLPFDALSNNSSNSSNTIINGNNPITITSSSNGNGNSGNNNNKNYYNVSKIMGKNNGSISSGSSHGSNHSHSSNNSAYNVNDNININRGHIITLAESKNIDILNEISDLKKFSQEFSGLSILENILNRPIEDNNNYSTYDRLTYNSSANSPNYPKFSTISRLPSQTRRQNNNDVKRRNSDLDFSKFQKGHNRTNSEHSRAESSKSSSSSSKKNIFNFFSNHKKSKSFSSSSNSSPYEKSLNSSHLAAMPGGGNTSILGGGVGVGGSNADFDFDKLIQGNDTLKLKLKPSNKIVTTPYLTNPLKDDDSCFSDDINNSDYTNSYMNFLNEKKNNTIFPQVTQPPINNIKDYTPLFKINHHVNPMSQMNSMNSMSFYGSSSGSTSSKNDIKNPYDPFNEYGDYSDNSRIENNKRSIMNQRMSPYSNHSQVKGYKSRY